MLFVSLFSILRQSNLKESLHQCSKRLQHFALEMRSGVLLSLLVQENVGFYHVSGLEKPMHTQGSEEQNGKGTTGTSFSRLLETARFFKVSTKLCHKNTSLWHAGHLQPNPNLYWNRETSQPSPYPACGWGWL